MPTYTIDFFNNRDYLGSTKLISEYFGINSDDVFSQLFPHFKCDYNILDFIEEFNLDMEQSFCDKTFITCRHAMTNYDNLRYLREFGLLNLKEMLQRKSPLHKFLLENGIKIDVTNKVIYYKDSIYSILHRKEKCNSGNCIFKEYECKSFFNNNLPDFMNCDYRKKLGRLEGKLYYDKCETEVFIDGTIEDIYRYDSIRFSPEILNTIEDITYFYDDKMGDLQNKWRYLPNNKYYILEFDIDINDFELLSTKLMYERYWEIDDILEKFGYDEYDFYENKVSHILYQNIFLLKRLINNFLWGSGEKYGQILPTTIIEGSKIRIIREHGVNERAIEEI